MTKQAKNLWIRDDGKTLFLYDIIGDWWNNATADIITQVIESAQDSITVRLHSYGGSADDGIAVYNALRRAAARGVAVTTTNDGSAYSAASLIFMAGDVRRAAANSTTMIHAAYLSGDDATENDLQRLDILNAAIAQIYTERSGADADKVAGWMSQDTWFSASDALALGLATEIESLTAVAALAQPIFANWVKEKEPTMKDEPTAVPPEPAVVPEPDAVKPDENKVVIDPELLNKLTADYGAEIAVAALSAGGGELEAAKLALTAKAEAEKAQAAKLAELEAEIAKLKAVPAPPASARPVAANVETPKRGGAFLAAITKKK